ncbi:ankyrin repeat-containing domain protein, partial [Ochromonadaceae sp. CCMP2298]
MSPDAKDIDGCSLLHWAAINSRVEIIQYLISKKADTNAVGGTNGETPLQWALRVQACSIAVSLLLAEGADMHHKSAYGCDALFIAVQCSQTNGAFVLLEEGADPNTLDANGDTPMHWLLRRPVGNIALDMLRLLLRFNASVTLRATLDGNNALHL